MNHAEFQVWFAHHTAAYTSISAWLAKKPVQSVDNEPGQHAILAAWFRQLKVFSFDEAARASDELAGQPEAEQPKSYDAHPRCLGELIRRKRRLSAPSRAYQPGVRESFRCLGCYDARYRFCWHPASMRAAFHGTIGRPDTLYSCVVRCDCQPPSETEPTYDPARWLEIPRGASLVEETGNLVAFVRALHERMAQRPANRYTEFEAFSRAGT